MNSVEFQSMGIRFSSPLFVRVSAGFMAAVPALAVLWFISLYGVNIPRWDQWDPDIAQMQTKSTAELTFADFWRQHNEHRIFIPRLVYFAIHAVANGNTIIEMFVGWIVVAITSLELLWLLTLTSSGDRLPPRNRFRAAVVGTWALMLTLLFSLSQAQNWLWGIGIVNFMPAMFTLAAIIAAANRSRYRWNTAALIVVFCSAATYSSGNGIVSWPLAGLVFAWSGSWQELRSKLLSASALACGCLLNIGIYLIGYVSPSHGTHNPYSGGLFQILKFFIVFIGNPFAEPLKSAPLLIPPLMGVALLIVFTICTIYLMLARRRNPQNEVCGNMIVWFAVAGYALCSAAIATTGRAGFGLAQALASRYVTFAIYLPIALIPLTAIVLRDMVLRNRISPGHARGLAGAGAALLILIQLLGLPRAISFARNWQRSGEREKAALLLLPVLSDDAQLISQFSPNPDSVVRFAPQLNARGYLYPPLIESRDASRLEVGGATSVVGAFLKTWQSTPDEIMCAGWASSFDGRRAASGVFITATDARGIPTIIGFGGMGATWRDVIPDFADTNLEGAGWGAKIPIDRLDVLSGAILLQAWVLDPDTGRAVRLKGSFRIAR